MPYTDKYTKQNTSYQNRYDPAGRYAIFGQVKFGQAFFGGNRKWFGKGKCIYKSKKAAMKAYRGYLGAKFGK